MSNDKKKALLNESTTRRFWKLAGLKPIHQSSFLFEEDENRGKKEDEELEEGEENEVQYLYGEFFKISPGKPIPASQGFRLMGSLNGSFSLGE